MRRPAIFVIDMLNDCFGHAELQRLRPSLCSSIDELTAMARAAGHPVNMHACIRQAAMDAYQRDFEVIIVRECVASKDAHHHAVTMDYLDGNVARVVSLCELRETVLEGRSG